jgi:hypothetical protein
VTPEQLPFATAFVQNYTILEQISKIAKLIKTRLTLAAATDQVNNEYNWNCYHTSGACIPT